MVVGLLPAQTPRLTGMRPPGAVLYIHYWRYPNLGTCTVQHKTYVLHPSLGLGASPLASCLGGPLPLPLAPSARDRMERRSSTCLHTGWGMASALLLGFGYVDRSTRAAFCPTTSDSRSRAKVHNEDPIYLPPRSPSRRYPDDKANPAQQRSLGSRLPLLPHPTYHITRGPAIPRKPPP